MAGHPPLSGRGDADDDVLHGTGYDKCFNFKDHTPAGCELVRS